MVATADNLIIEDAEVIFRNFAGAEKTFNSAGDRNFCVILEPKLADKLKKDGWNVKELKAREEGDEPRQYLQVAVNYSKGRPPRVLLISNNGKNRVDLGSDEVEMLDYADVKIWDLVLNPYPWDVNGNTGIKAYLKNAFVTINENALELKYADMDEENQVPPMSSTASDS